MTLFEILGQEPPAAVQPHLRKCFDAIKVLEFGDQASGAIDIFAMLSPKGERIELGKNLKARGAVEEWLLEVEKDMRKSLHGLAKNGVIRYQEMAKMNNMVAKAKLPSARLCGVDPQQPRSKPRTSSGGQIMVCNQRAAVEPAHTCCARQVDETATTRHCRTCTVNAHARDIVEAHACPVISTDDFGRQQQPRTYWEEDIDDMVVRQSTPDYMNEYMGAVADLSLPH